MEIWLQSFSNTILGEGERSASRAGCFTTGKINGTAVTQWIGGRLVSVTGLEALGKNKSPSTTEIRAVTTFRLVECWQDFDGICCLHSHEVQGKRNFPYICLILKV